MVTHLIIGGFRVVMMVQAYRLSLFQWNTEIAILAIPKASVSIPVVISGGLLLIFSSVHLIRLFVPLPEKPSWD